MKIVKHLLILTLGLSFVACSGKSDNKDENNGKIIEKPESACDCIKNTKIVADKILADCKKCDNEQLQRKLKDVELSEWARTCDKEYGNIVRVMRKTKDCDVAKEAKQSFDKLRDLREKLKDEAREKEEEARRDEEESRAEATGGGAYDGSEYEGSEYDGPADAPDAYDGE
jgi:hypothetical protein